MSSSNPTFNLAEVAEKMSETESARKAGELAELEELVELSEVVTKKIDDYSSLIDRLRAQVIMWLVGFYLAIGIVAVVYFNLRGSVDARLLSSFAAVGVAVGASGFAVYFKNRLTVIRALQRELNVERVIQRQLTSMVDDQLNRILPKISTVQRAIFLMRIRRLDRKS